MHLKPSRGFLKARNSGTPIIAFESAVITHGLPYPQNLTLIKDLQETARDSGTYLATFWLDDAHVKIGFEEDELERFASNKEAVKVSVRDIPYVLANRLSGGTTVAATLFLAKQAGLEVFATGGLGGVHFGVERSFDISNDLFQLSVSPMIVVSAGIKAILDVAKTLEMLETLSIPVFGYRTESFPLFYSRESDYPVRRIESVVQIARLFRTHQESGLQSALVIANPVPEKWSLKKEAIKEVIAETVKEAEMRGVTGQNVTPYLLEKLSHSNIGTVATNIALIKNNVALAGEIVRELQRGA